MLNSRLTSILISNIALLSLGACSLFDAKEIKKHKSNNKILADINRCQVSNLSLDEKHLLMSLEGQSKVLVNCFKNYMRFESNKDQSVFSCNRLLISKKGLVRKVDVFSFSHKLPKDYQMCIRQEFWKMRFSGLHLSRSYKIVFPISFTSKK